LKEDFKEERHYAQDHIDQAEKEAVAQNHSDQADTESATNEGLAGEGVIDPIEEVKDTTMKPAKNEEDTMSSMKNHEDFKDLMKEDKDFGDTTQIANRGSAACGRDRRPHQRRS